MGPAKPSDFIYGGAAVVIILIGLLGLGAAGVAAGSTLSSFFGRIGAALSAHDPTGLSALIPGAGWRYYTVTGGFPYRPPATYRLASGSFGRSVSRVRSCPGAMRCVTSVGTRIVPSASRTSMRKFIR